MPQRRAKPSALSDHLGYWLRRVSNHVSNSFRDTLQARERISVAEWVVLRTMYDERQSSPSDIVEITGLTKGAVSKTVERLRRKALVTRKRSDVDGRAQHISLTSKGRALVPRLAAIADENDAAYFGGLSRSDAEALLRITQALAEQHGFKDSPID